MNKEKIYTEEELYNDGIQMISNGHGMAYIFKYMRSKTGENTALRQRVMERLNANTGVQKVQKQRLEHIAERSKPNAGNLIIGLGLMVFATVIWYVLRDMGWVSTIPIWIALAVLGVWSRGGR